MAESIRVNVRFDMGEGENFGDWVMPLIRVGTIVSGTFLGWRDWVILGAYDSVKYHSIVAFFFFLMPKAVRTCWNIVSPLLLNTTFFWFSSYLTGHYSVFNAGYLHPTSKCCWIPGICPGFFWFSALLFLSVISSSLISLNTFCTLMASPQLPSWSLQSNIPNCLLDIPT